MTKKTSEDLVTIYPKDPKYLAMSDEELQNVLDELVGQLAEFNDVVQGHVALAEREKALNAPVARTVAKGRANSLYHSRPRGWE